ncbi:hypothetical protein IEU95_07660 [Hoyosella rhizosphaerae]|uniref:hypothetical protein n=1 Tax=Hoyosella rhizosphaerae TaxID=1755582 RepID=UPI00166AFB8D|nr:hypothetical protein [Hoyosella rhizosphaerae]MBN4926701.1 hypothetical protein [Hoyosella rhizosphaerae]
MNISVRRTLSGLCAGALIGGASILGMGATASAAPAPTPASHATCTAYPVFGTGAFSQCAVPTAVHRVTVRCVAWWAPWLTYDRHGPYVSGWQQSWTSCDAPFTLRGWGVQGLH